VNRSKSRYHAPPTPSYHNIHAGCIPDGGDIFPVPSQNAEYRRVPRRRNKMRSCFDQSLARCKQQCTYRSSIPPEGKSQTDIGVHQNLGLSIKQAIQRRGGKQVQAYVVMALHDDGDVTTHTTDQVSRCTSDIFAIDAEERLRIAHRESMLKARTGQGYLGTFVSLQHSRHALIMTRRPRPDLSSQLWRRRFPK
jgi:hypothetical protein